MLSIFLVASVGDSEMETGFQEVSGMVILPMVLGCPFTGSLDETWRNYRPDPKASRNFDPVAARHAVKLLMPFKHYGGIFLVEHVSELCFPGF